MRVEKRAKNWVTAIILAAGQSRRMGAPKLNLPWGETTVLGHVLDTLVGTGLNEFVLVTGGSPIHMQPAWQSYPLKVVFNVQYEQGEMLSSLQLGLRCAHPIANAALIVLGDQPQIESHVVQSLLDTYAHSEPRLVAPSYQRKRGHPWLVSRQLWPALLELQPPATLRDFLNEKGEEIRYVLVDSESVLQDLDTPADYQAFRPGRLDETNLEN